MISPQGPRSGRRHRKRLRNRLPARAWLGIAAAIGTALIIAITVPALLGATSGPHGKPAPTVTVRVPVPRPTVTVTVPRPGPTVTVTVLRRARPSPLCAGTLAVAVAVRSARLLVMIVGG